MVGVAIKVMLLLEHALGLVGEILTEGVTFGKTVMLTREVAGVVDAHPALEYNVTEYVSPSSTVVGE